jgi:hypothetical protein
VGEVVGAFSCWDCREKVDEGVIDCLLGTFGGLAQAVFELGEEHLDRVEVRRVLGQEEELGTGGPESLTDGAAPMGSEIVHDDDVAWSQGRDEDLVDVLAEGLAIDRALDEPRRLDAIMPKGSEEGHGRPAAMWHLRREALATRAPAAQRRHIGLGPGLVDEDETGGIDPILVGLPLLASSRHVGTIALAGDQRLFL